MPRYPASTFTLRSPDSGRGTEITWFCWGLVIFMLTGRGELSKSEVTLMRSFNSAPGIGWLKRISRCTSSLVMWSRCTPQTLGEVDWNSTGTGTVMDLPSTLVDFTNLAVQLRAGGRGSAKSKRTRSGLTAVHIPSRGGTNSNRAWTTNSSISASG